MNLPAAPTFNYGRDIIGNVEPENATRSNKRTAKE
jgi:hypothetical protein